MRTRPDLAQRNRERARHGHTRDNTSSGTYNSWSSMMERGSGSADAERYAARGLGMCERWKLFENFLADMGERPSGTSIDRIDNDRGYEPGNCRWATSHQQARNRRNNKRVTARGETMCISEWAERSGIARATIGYRIRAGWPVEAAIFTHASKKENNRWRQQFSRTPSR